MPDREIFAAPIARALWRIEPGTLPRWQAAGLRGLRLVYAVVRDAIDGSIPLHAASLVYTTLLSFVPLLAISFSVLKSFGVHNRLEPLLAEALAPLGSMAKPLTDQIIGFVDRVEVGVLGAVGLAFLVYTAIIVIQKIEFAFNEIWHVGQSRPIGRKFADYLSVLLIAPVLIFSALGMIATFKSSTFYQDIESLPVLGWLLQATVDVTPYLLLVAALTFVYVFVPNTSVRRRSAVIGALVAAALWLVAGRAFAGFVAGANTYTAVYSAAATILLFMLWLYVTWMILLVGARVAFYDQHPERLTISGDTPGLNPAAFESVALSVVALVTRAYYRAEPAPTERELAKRHGLPEDNIGPLVDALENAGVLARTAAEPAGLIPASAPDATPLIRVVRALRGTGDGHGAPTQFLDPAALAFGRRIDAALADAVAACTMKDLANTTDVDDAPATEDAPPRLPPNRGRRQAVGENRP
jgi:membrane protein